MTYALHTRAGLSPPWSSFNKRYLNTGTGATSAGAGAIADGFAASQIVIELETVLGEYNTVQSSVRNFLFHCAVTNTGANNFAGIHYMPNGKIEVVAGVYGNNRKVESINSYVPGDLVKIRWELQFASITSGLVGTQTLYINDVLQGSQSARSDQFAALGARFALNSAVVNDNNVQVERITDQKVRRLYINYIDGGYERLWNFNQSTGFSVPNSANAVNDPLYLYGRNGINTLGGNWPEDGSQWIVTGSPVVEGTAVSNNITNTSASAAIATTGSSVVNLLTSSTNLAEVAISSTLTTGSVSTISSTIEVLHLVGLVSNNSSSTIIETESSSSVTRSVDSSLLTSTLISTVFKSSSLELALENTTSTASNILVSSETLLTSTSVVLTSNTYIVNPLVIVTSGATTETGSNFNITINSPAIQSDNQTNTNIIGSGAGLREIVSWASTGTQVDYTLTLVSEVTSLATNSTSLEYSSQKFVEKELDLLSTTNTSINLSIFAQTIEQNHLATSSLVPNKVTEVNIVNTLLTDAPIPSATKISFLFVEADSLSTTELAELGKFVATQTVSNTFNSTIARGFNEGNRPLQAEVFIYANLTKEANIQTNWSNNYTTYSLANNKTSILWSGEGVAVTIEAEVL